VALYIHSPIRLHGVVLNYLSTGTTLQLCSDGGVSYSKAKEGSTVDGEDDSGA
jgi:hypothetical protein